MKSVILCGLLLTVFLAASGNDYEGYQVIRLQLRTDCQLSELKKIGEKLQLDFWKGVSLTRPTDVMVSPTTKEKVIQFAKENGIKYETFVNDVAKSIDKNMKENKKAQVLAYLKRSENDITSYFAKHGEINRWIDSMAASNQFVSVASLGKSYEGRDMKILKIGTGGNKPIVFLDAGIHAREWIAPASLIYLTKKLIDNYKSGDSVAKALINKFEIHILPVVNPDGYDYTFQSRNSRLWRKTRQPHGRCIGADPNRNFDSAFGGPGTSSDSCSDIYHGPSAFSEPETANLRDHILAQNQRVKVYMTTHAYSQMWFIPYGYSKRNPRDYDELMRVARIGADAIRRTNGLRFTVGSPAQILYEASGGSFDWTYDRANVKYSMGFELRPSMRERRIGFMAPTSFIKPSGEEFYNGVTAALQAVRV